MRILFCTNSIGTRGGIERVTIVKANALAEMKDADGRCVNLVGIAYSDRFNFPETVHPLSPLVKTFDTEADIWHDWNYKGLERWTEPRRKMRNYHRELQRIVSEFRPDIIIGVGQSEKFIIPKLKVTWPMVRIREIHFNSGYRKMFFTGNGVINNLKRRISDFIDFKINCRAYDKAFLLTKQDKEENFAQDNNFGWMWNPSSFPVDQSANADAEKKRVVIASGRLHHLKGFDSLLRIWSNLGDKKKGWTLRVVGEGGELENLKRITNNLGLTESVDLAGFSSDVASRMRESSILVQASWTEGFSLVIVEAMSCRLPVVSFDTKYGPRDIIRDGVDGFLVENRDEKVFADKLYQLMSDAELREKMAANAEERAKEFDVNKIAARWMEEYRKLMAEKLRRLNKC